MSQEELATKRRALNAVRLQLARFGISAPVNLIMDEEDLVKDIRAIEHELGISQTPTINERRASVPTAPRYQEPVTPEPVFQQRIAQQQSSARQADIQHQFTLLTTHRSNMAHYRAQAKAFGGIDLAPPMTRNGMNEQREGIARCKANIRQLGQPVDDLPGDE